MGRVTSFTQLSKKKRNFWNQLWSYLQTNVFQQLGMKKMSMARLGLESWQWCLFFQQRWWNKPLELVFLSNWHIWIHEQSTKWHGLHNSSIHSFTLLFGDKNTHVQVRWATLLPELLVSSHCLWAWLCSSLYMPMVFTSVFTGRD